MIKTKKPPKPLKRTPLKRKPFPNRKLETESGSVASIIKEPKYTLPNPDIEKVQKYVKPVKSEKNRKYPKQSGKKTAEWEIVRAELKKEFESMGITHCELRYVGCWVNQALSFAHSKKRRYIKTKEDMYEVVLACIPCHEKIEVLGSKGMITMEDVVKKVIERRNLELSKWKRIS